MERNCWDSSYIEPYLKDWLKYARESDEAEQQKIDKGDEFRIPYAGVQTEMISAIFSMASRFEIEPHAKYMAVHLLDRYLGLFFWELIADSEITESTLRRARSEMFSQIKLVLVSCLQIASKVALFSTGLGIPMVKSLFIFFLFACENCAVGKLLDKWITCAGTRHTAIGRPEPRVHPRHRLRLGAAHPQDPGLQDTLQSAHRRGSAVSRLLGAARDARAAGDVSGAPRRGLSPAQRDIRRAAPAGPGQTLRSLAEGQPGFSQVRGERRLHSRCRRRLFQLLLLPQEKRRDGLRRETGGPHRHECRRCANYG
ncbi:unnamed protein product [Trichogramma brassicae]|uniref:Uncharacterized protein n=1 Tax=Trichogramma brassicae TaxID=86971 RepID=A0A6H5ID20_9HYME|nr:unnamed protein product [Trichogramma brassicae]